MNKYLLAYDDGNMIIRSRRSKLPQRYDPKTKQWLEDVRLCRMFFGDMPVRAIKRKDAERMICFGK
ncbi:hypothetical protein [uncultured Faecalibaculum sp.]|uniref:hypothetical protein n=1 Tax=uncultured Faecalibaculum sp. TaxID=1729681 RepID=UPI00272DCCCD|nr:hypothetical protein [uncultured Faecalibaculum sp.]